MSIYVTMLQTRLGEDRTLWLEGQTYLASDSFGAMLIASNLATGVQDEPLRTAPVFAITDAAGHVIGLSGFGAATVNMGGEPARVVGLLGLGKVLSFVMAPGWSYGAVQWRRDTAGTVVNATGPGATGPAYTQVEADVAPGVKVFPVFSGLVFSAYPLASSAAAPPPAPAPAQAPQNLAPPSISGTAQAGQQLTASPGVWTGNPAPAYSYQWLRAGVAVAGATGGTYTLSSADVGAQIAVQVTATNSAGSPQVVSAPTATVIAAGGGNVAPANTALPTISGTAQVGSTLSSTVGSWTGTPTPTYARQWLRDGSPISGATGATYLLSSADLGAAISVRVVATNSVDSAQATSAPTAAVVAAPADSRARFGVGSATAGVTSPEALLSSMSVMTGASNGSKVGSFNSTGAVPAGQYGWSAFEASASADGVTFTEPLGTGGWQGARSSGNNGSDPGDSPNTSDVTAVINGVTWRFFRQNYANAGGQFTTA